MTTPQRRLEAAGLSLTVHERTCLFLRAFFAGAEFDHKLAAINPEDLGDSFADYGVT
jgi:hypothetical protein